MIAAPLQQRSPVGVRLVQEILDALAFDGSCELPAVNDRRGLIGASVADGRHEFLSL
jgi:hypothetical protein